MKAFLLAAGFGTRLRPLTDTIPKCMVPIQGKPLLGWWFDLLSAHGISEALVNTHYLPDLVRAYIHEYNARRTGLCVTEFHESVLLGSGGTVKANRDFVGPDKAFFICYADNLTNINLSAMLAYHKSVAGVLTMALFRSGNPEQCGIAELDAGSRIVSFTEKPVIPKGNLANAGIYIAGQGLFDRFPDTGFIDFGKDVLPGLAGSMYGWETSGYLIDIGTPDNYQKAQKEWKK